jgi:hypothetical protein
MSQKELFAASVAALILACAANWAIVNTKAHVAPQATVQIDPFTMMVGARISSTDCATSPDLPVGAFSFAALSRARVVRQRSRTREVAE